MKLNLHFILFCIILTLVVSCTNWHHTPLSERCKSLWQQEIEASGARDLNRTLAIIDTLEMEKLLGTPKADYTRASAYDWAWQMRLAEHFFQKSYNACKLNPSADWSLYAETGYRTAYFHYSRYDLEGALGIITEVLSASDGNEAFPINIKSGLLLLMSNCQVRLHQNDAARHSIKSAYEVGCQSVDKEDALGFVILCCNIFASFFDMGDYEVAQQFLQRSTEALAVYEQHGDSLLIEEWRGNLALNQAELLLAMGHSAESTAVYDAIPTSRIFTPASLEAAAHYLVTAGRYDEAIDYYNRRDDVSRNNGSNVPNFDNIAGRLNPRYNAYRKAGRNAEALTLADSISTAIDSALVLQKKSDAAELAVIYQTHEKELALEKSETRSLIYRILAVAAFLICLLITFLLWRSYKYNRILRSKNRRLLEDIELREREEKQAIEQLKIEPEEQLTAEQQLFRRLNLLMDEQQPYTDENLNRDMLAQLLGTNAKYVVQAIHECSHGETVTDFITRYRLEHVAHLLKTTNDAIAIIGEMSGIPSRATLARLFRNEYGMTCTEFREVAKEK